MEARTQAELDEEFKPVRRGWCLGSKEFRAEMLKYIETQTGKWHYIAELRESGQAKAERLIEKALQSDGVSAHPLEIWRNGHPFKIKPAARLREQTTVTVAWIAERLTMGSRGHLMHLLYQNGKGTDFGNEQQRSLGI